MMPYELVFLDRKCQECGNKIAQAVFFKMENDKVTIQTCWKNCLVCQTSLPKPTEQEVRESPYFIK
jgi:hypothetical protein